MVVAGKIASWQGAGEAAPRCGGRQAPPPSVLLPSVSISSFGSIQLLVNKMENLWALA